MPAIKIYMISLLVSLVSGMIILIQDQNSKKVYSKSWCLAHSMLSCIPSWDTLCKMCGRPFFFLVYSACMNFFHSNFLLHDIFFCTSLPPPPPPSPTPITFIMVRPLRLQRTRPFAAHCKKRRVGVTTCPALKFRYHFYRHAKKEKKLVGIAIVLMILHHLTKVHAFMGKAKICVTNHWETLQCI